MLHEAPSCPLTGHLMSPDVSASAFRSPRGLRLSRLLRKHRAEPLGKHPPVRAGERGIDCNGLGSGFYYVTDPAYHVTPSSWSLRDLRACLGFPDLHCPWGPGLQPAVSQALSGSSQGGGGGIGAKLKAGRLQKPEYGSAPTGPRPHL